MLVDPMKAHPGDVSPRDGDPVLSPRVWEMHDVSEHPARVEDPPDEPCSRERAVARLPISVRRDRTAEVEAGRFGSAYMASAVEFDRDAIIAYIALQSASKSTPWTLEPTARMKGIPASFRR